MKIINRIGMWLPIILLLIIPIAFLIFHACGYEIYIVNGEKYPWIVNSEELLKIDSLNNNSVELLLSLKRDGLVLSPQEYANHTYNFFFMVAYYFGSCNWHCCVGFWI